jgi:hypothetical protein
MYLPVQVASHYHHQFYFIFYFTFIEFELEVINGVSLSQARDLTVHASTHRARGDDLNWWRLLVPVYACIIQTGPTDEWAGPTDESQEGYSVADITEWQIYSTLFRAVPTRCIRR